MMTQTMRKPRPLAFVKPVKRISKKEDKGIYFSPYEWEVFSKELELGRDIKTALHRRSRGIAITPSTLRFREGVFYRRRVSES